MLSRLFTGAQDKVAQLQNLSAECWSSWLFEESMICSLARGESRHKSFPTSADILLTHSSALLLTYFQLLPCMLTSNVSSTIINH